jgi:protein-disulfide isomerase
VKSSEIKIFGIILIFALILVGVAVMPLLLRRGDMQDLEKPVDRPKLNREILVTPGTHLKGDAKAHTTIVVFSDFQCPSCRESVPVVEEIMQKKKGQVNEVYHHFQVKPEHNFSQALSRAAEAAGKQGKFWEMHDILFNRQKELVAAGNEDQLLTQIRQYAKSIGLDMIQFDAVMAKKDDSQFKKDMDLGIGIGLIGTPSYFVIDPNGKVKQYNSTAGLRLWADGVERKVGDTQG